MLVGGFLTVHPFSSLAVLVLSVVVALVVAGIGELTANDRAASDQAATPDGDEDTGDDRRRHWLRAAVSLGAAVAVLVWPGATIRVVAVVVGVALVVGGVLDLLEGRRAAGTHRWNALLGGVSGVLFGLLALAWPDVSVVVIAVVFGARLVIAGFRLVARSAPPAPGEGGRADSAPASGASSGATAGRAPRVRGGWLRLVGNVVALGAAALLVVVGVTLARGAPSPGDFYASPEDVPAEPGRLLRSEPFTSAEIPSGARAWRILYTTTRDERETPALASGLVIVPEQGGDAPLPVVAWAHGTTGIASGCAPSVLEDGLKAGAMMVQDNVIGQGWALVATDYTGLGTEGPHPYLIGQGEGRSVLDAIRAAHQLRDVTLAPETVVWGHSQGGHAALWTGILAPTYAPDITIDGVAALAPASNLPALVTVLGRVTGGDIFASFVVQAYTDSYEDLDYSAIVRPGARLIVREMAARCLSEKSSLVSLLTTLTLDKPIWQGNPDRGRFHDRLVANVPTGTIPAPLLVGQGADDSLILPAAQRAYVQERCEAGYAVDYREYPGLNHVPLVEPDSALVPELLAWTSDRFAGKPASNTC